MAAANLLGGTAPEVRAEAGIVDQAANGLRDGVQVQVRDHHSGVTLNELACAAGGIEADDRLAHGGRFEAHKGKRVFAKTSQASK